MPAPNWSTKVSQIALIREAMREGEAMLAAQVAIATSADQRATVLAGIYVAAATGVMGALLTKTAQLALPATIGAAVTAIAFLVGAYLSITATMPVKFFTPGVEPSQWYKDIELGVAEEVAFGEQLENYDEHIKYNETRVLQRNAWYFKWGARLGIFAPVIGLFAAGITCLVLASAKMLLPSAS